jgi:pimeloyl-ACP methyl ester carboxylesterase
LPASNNNNRQAFQTFQMMPTTFRPLLACLLYLAALAGCTTLPNTTRVTLEGAPIALARSGSGSPLIVFQSGLGDGMAVWSAVLGKLPASVATLAYDRPGYGGSAGRSGRRDACSVARELHALLQATGNPPPYLLVGHSLGGLYQYAFAKLYPDEVSGILLLDPTHPEHWANLQRRTPNTAAVIQSLRTVAFSGVERQEFDDQAECTSALQALPAATAPALLLQRGRAEPGESEEFQAVSRELAARWPDLLPGMTRLRVAGAGHYLQKERPELVVQEIISMQAGARVR